MAQLINIGKWVILILALIAWYLVCYFVTCRATEAGVTYLWDKLKIEI